MASQVEVQKKDNANYESELIKLIDDFVRTAGEELEKENRLHDDTPKKVNGPSGLHDSSSMDSDDSHQHRKKKRKTKNKIKRRPCKPKARSL